MRKYVWITPIVLFVLSVALGFLLIAMSGSMDEVTVNRKKFKDEDIKGAEYAEIWGNERTVELPDSGMYVVVYEIEEGSIDDERIGFMSDSNKLEIGRSFHESRKINYWTGDYEVMDLSDLFIAQYKYIDPNTKEAIDDNANLEDNKYYVSETNGIGTNGKEIKALYEDMKEIKVYDYSNYIGSENDEAGKRRDGILLGAITGIMGIVEIIYGFFFSAIVFGILALIDFFLRRIKRKKMQAAD